MSDDKAHDIGKVRVSIARSLTSIEQLALDLHAQALNSPNDRDFPGGTALHMLAPAAVLQDWERQYEDREEAERWDDDGTDRWEKQPRLNPAIDQGDDTEQPLNVLCFWTRVIREDRDQPTNLAPTISREVDYLRGALDWACRVDIYGESEWPLCFDMAGELRTLVRRMEDVLSDGYRPTFGVPCLYCNDKLIRVETTVGGLQDTYKCMNPQCSVKDYEKAAYDKAVEQSYLLNATELTAEHMAIRTNVKASKIRVWGVRYEGIKVGGQKNPKRNHDGLLLYDVAAVEAKRDELAGEDTAA